MAKMANFVFRAVVRAYMWIERGVVNTWHPDYQRAFARLMFGVKRRLFPGQGQAALLNRLDEGLVNTAAWASSEQASPTVVEMVVEDVSDPVETSPHVDVTTPDEPQYEPNASFHVSAQVEEAPKLEQEFSTWLWLEQENLKPVARHLGFAYFDWNHLPLRRGGGEGIGVSPEVESVLSLLKSKKISNVLILPWLKYGGADKAAIAYLRVMAGRLPGRVLAITTEPGESPWLSKLPEGVEVVEWSKVSVWPYAGEAVRNLGWMLFRLRPEVVHVMNSWLGWELLARDGMRLRSISRTYASLFWYGPSDHGRLRGYAPDYLPRVIGALDGVITDNMEFPRQLQRDYGFSLDHFHCIWHPTDWIADRPLPLRAGNERLTFLWASRFAPEKRLDILAIIAARRPQHRFVVYGAQDGDLPGLADSIQNLNNLPNVEMRGSFDGFESLPANHCDAFLYTSSSDGMPNVVVEALAHGLPLIAPLVGGIGDLVDANTGWLVEKSDLPETYLAAIDDLVAHPDLRTIRATAALQRVRERHDYVGFESRLLSIPGYLPRD